MEMSCWRKCIGIPTMKGVKMPYGDDDSLIHKDSACFIIENAPTIEPEQRWIPVTERLPEKRDWYLGIFKEPDTGWINPIPFICDYVGKETKATTKECWILKECTDREEHIDYYFNLECVAWMPLPEPYQAESEE